MIVISINHLSKVYNKRITAMDDVCLDIEEGIFFGLLGPNGAGKSTLINTLAGLEATSSGTLKFFGKPVQGRSRTYLRRTGFVLQKPVYVEKLKVGEYLRFAGCLYQLEDRIIPRRIEDLLSLFDLKDERDTMIENLSFGMKKRVSMAYSLIHRPDLLVLDEPFEGMDPIIQNRIESFLLHLVEEGGTILLATHNLHQVEKLCDTAAIMDRGKIKHQCTLSTFSCIKEKGDGINGGCLEGLFFKVLAEEENQHILCTH